MGSGYDMCFVPVCCRGFSSGCAHGMDSFANFFPLKCGAFQFLEKTDERLHVIGFTLPETNGLPLKIGAPWKRRFLLETIIFRGELLVLGSVIDLIDLIDHTFPIQKHRRMDRSSFDKHRPETVIPLVKMVLDVFLLVVFDGLYHGKSHLFTTIWENMFYLFQASNKQIQVVKSDEKHVFSAHLQRNRIY